MQKHAQNPPSKICSVSRALSFPMIRRFVLLSLVLFAAGVVYSRYFGVCGDAVYVQIGPSEYCVPREAAEYEISFNPFSLIPGLDQSPEGTQALILFSRFEYKEAVPEYEIERNINNDPMGEDLILISYLTDEEVRRYKYHGANEKYFQDLWFGEGQWSDRRLEKFEKNGWYRAYWLAEGGSWQVIKDMPSRESKNYLDEGFSIAFCHFTVLNRKTCKTSYIDESRKILIDLDLDEENLPFREEIGVHILRKLDSWAYDSSKT